MLFRSFFKQKTAYEILRSDWSSDVCSSDLALAEAASFARTWVPFCRKHGVEPRCPEAYFSQKRDFLKNKVRLDFVRERRKVKREYDEFKVRVNSLPEAIRRRSDAYNAGEELRARRRQQEEAVAAGGTLGTAPLAETLAVKGTWMSDGSQWHGTWLTGATDHARGDHAGIIQVIDRIHLHTCLFVAHISAT